MTPPSSDLQSLLGRQDPDLSALLDREVERQETTLTLIASENHASSAVRAACASVLTDKYAEGYPGRRYYGGCAVADDVEDLARKRAVELFGADHANVQPHSGTTANMAVLVALAGRDGKLLGMSLSEGGHLTHGHKVSHTGKLFDAAQYGVDAETGLLDYDKIRDAALEFRPNIIIAGASSYPREIDYAKFAEISREVEAFLLADIAHPAGLIAGRVLPSPIGHADVVTMTTHKTLRGPRGGLILCTDEIKKKIDSSVFPGGQGGPLMHQIAGKAVAFGEALDPSFREYQTTVRDNARHFAACLEERGLDIVTGGTDTHMVVVDLRRKDVTGHDVESRCFEAGITLNKNMVPGDQRKPTETSGIRVGTSAGTTRGLGKDEFGTIARIIADVVDGGDAAKARNEVFEMTRAFPLP